MAKKRRSYHYKFTQKKQSVKGIISIVFALVAIALFVCILYISYQEAGNGGPYIGLVGLWSFFCAMAGLCCAISSLIENNSFLLYPRIGMVCNSLVVIIWGGVYFLGF